MCLRQIVACRVMPNGSSEKIDKVRGLSLFCRADNIGLKLAFIKKTSVFRHLPTLLGQISQFFTDQAAYGDTHTTQSNCTADIVRNLFHYRIFLFTHTHDTAPF